MIFQRALRRELMSAAGAVFTTLFSITITVMLIRILGQAAGGRVASGDVVALIGFASLNYLPIILILTGFISVLLVVSRSYQDSEMVVWFASGLSLTKWIRPVLAFGWPLVLLTALLSFLLTPWANGQSALYKERFNKRADVAKVAPGKFQESSSADRIFFVEGVSGDATKVKNVFVSSTHNNRSSVVVAREGTVATDSAGDKFLIMSQGRRYEGTPSQADYRMMEFERYGVLVASQSQALLNHQTAQSLPTLDLLADRNKFNMSQLLWRAALPLMSLLLMLLAIPLGFVNPRSGRSINLVIALLLFITYSNLLSFFQATVAQGRFSFALAWWPVHLMTATAIVLLFWWRLKVNSRFHPLALLAAWRRCKPSKSARCSS